MWDYPEATAARTRRRASDRHGGRTGWSRTPARGWRVLETSQAPAYYFPVDDVDEYGARDRSTTLTFCEWKGQASYVDVVVGPDRRRDAGWRYRSPTPAFTDITGCLAFYPARVDRCTVGSEVVRPNDGDFYGGWITSNVVGPFEGGPGHRRLVGTRPCGFVPSPSSSAVVYNCIVTDGTHPERPVLEVDAVLREGDADGALLLPAPTYMALIGGRDRAEPILRDLDRTRSTGRPRRHHTPGLSHLGGGRHDLRAAGGAASLRCGVHKSVNAPRPRAAVLSLHSVHRPASGWDATEQIERVCTWGTSKGPGLVLGLLLTFSLVAAACGGDDDNASSSTTAKAAASEREHARRDEGHHAPGQARRRLQEPPQEGRSGTRRLQLLRRVLRRHRHLALAAEEAKTDGSDYASKINGITRGGRSARTTSRASTIIKAGGDIDYDGQSGELEFSGNGEPTKASYGVLQFGTTGCDKLKAAQKECIDDAKTKFVAGDRTQGSRRARGPRRGHPRR